MVDRRLCKIAHSKRLTKIKLSYHPTIHCLAMSLSRLLAIALTTSAISFGSITRLQAAVALHFAHYNLVWLHKMLRVTPAMAANVTDRLWSLEELVDRTSA
jgi:hypothetical protein